jgi:hypothetical protein
MIRWYLLLTPIAVLKLINQDTKVISREVFVFGVRVIYWTCNP